MAYMPLASRPSLFARIERLIAVRRGRLSLRDMDEARLSDIGLSREQVRREAARPAWDAADHWIKPTF